MSYRASVPASLPAQSDPSTERPAASDSAPGSTLDTRRPTDGVATTGGFGRAGSTIGSTGLHNPTGRTRLALAFLLAMLGALGPLNIDMYLPSFPEISTDLRASPSMVQLSLTACLIGLAIGQVIVGPISDAEGRRRPLALFLLLFAAASLLCALAPNVGILVAARFLQGLTASAGIVISRAVIRDVFTGSNITKFFALMMAINATAPMIAPMAGGLILALPFASWHLVFLVLAAVGLLITLVVTLRLPETLPVERRVPASSRNSLSTMGQLLRDRSFVPYAIIVGVVQGGTFAYVAGTPFIYQDIYQVSPQVFSVLFGINGIAIILGNLIVGRASGWIRERTLLRTGILCAFAATAVILATALTTGPLPMLVAALWIYMCSMGLVTTSAFTLAMRNQSHRAGAASGVMGTFPLAIGSLAAPLVGLDDSSAAPMGLIMFTTASLGTLAFFLLSRRDRSEVSTYVPGATPTPERAEPTIR